MKKLLLTALTLAFVIAGATVGFAAVGGGDDPSGSATHQHDEHGRGHLGQLRRGRARGRPGVRGQRPGHRRRRR